MVGVWIPGSYSEIIVVRWLTRISADALFVFLLIAPDPSSLLDSLIPPIDLSLPEKPTPGGSGWHCSNKRVLATSRLGLGLALGLGVGFRSGSNSGPPCPAVLCRLCDMCTRIVLANH